MDFVAAAARLGQYAGAVVLFGAPLFRLYGAGAARAAWLPRLAAPALVLLLIGGVASLSSETASMTGEAAAALQPSAWVEVLAGTGFGRGLAVRLALAVAAGAVLALGWRRRWLARGLAATGAAVMASFAWTGHGAGGEGASGLIHLAADVAHLLAAGVWLGALAAIAALAGGPGGAAETAEALRRFSGIGPAVVAALVATGVVNAAALIGWNDLAATGRSGYGRVLIAKLLLFALMLGLAGLNRWRLAPRLAGAVASDPERAFAAARTSVLLETGLGFAVLASVALLGLLPPPAGA